MRMQITAFCAALMLAACDPGLMAGADPEPLPLHDGYRHAADPCRIVGENDYTNQFLDHTLALVGCPEDYDGIDEFIAETGAFQVDQAQGYILFSVPLE
jgi:hypothetical protein